MARNSQLPFVSRPLLNFRGLKVRSFMKLPTIYYGSNGNSGVVSCNPVLYLEYDPPYNPNQYTRPSYKELQFKINPRNHGRVIKFLAQLYSWFTEPQFADLFIEDEHSGGIMINMEHRHLTAQVKGSMLDGQVMQAVPAVYSHDGTMREGCALSINNTAYTVMLTDEDVETLYHTVARFSFQSEALLLLEVAKTPELVTDEAPRRSTTEYNGKPNRIEW